MESGELKSRLGQILAEEEGDGAVDWGSVERLSGVLLGELQVPVPPIVTEYLRGFDRRKDDVVFGLFQRGQLLLYLRGPSGDLS
jgi:hypothetical protein